jgi:hypothetical protein
MIAHLRIRLAHASSGALMLGACACHGCRDDHPYVPYSIGDLEGAKSSATANSQVAPLDEGGASFAQQAATNAPPTASRGRSTGCRSRRPRA